MKIEELETIINQINQGEFASLSICQKKINGDEAIKIAAALKESTTLTTLDFSFNFAIGDEGVTAIAETLRHNTTLTALDIRSNNISTEGAKAIAAALQHNTTLTTLDFSFNPEIGDEGVTAIAQALKQNTTLRTLGFEANINSDESFNVFVKALRYNTTLTTLSLKLGRISAEDAMAFAEVLKDNKVLKTLNFDEDIIDDEGAIIIAEVLETNTTLTSLIVGYLNAEIKERMMDLLKRNRDIEATMEELREIYLGEPQTYMDWLYTYPGSAPIPQQALEGTNPFELSQNKHLFWQMPQYQASLLEWMPADTMQKLPDFQKALYTSPAKPGK